MRESSLYQALVLQGSICVPILTADKASRSGRSLVVPGVSLSTVTSERRREMLEQQVVGVIEVGRVLEKNSFISVFLLTTWVEPEMCSGDV